MRRSPNFLPLLVLLAAGCPASPKPVDDLPPQLTTQFPTTFLWGTATAPYQIEGGLHDTDWYQWESTPANVKKAHADDGDHSYELYDTDSKLAKDLHNNAMRLGIDWSRLFPTAASFPSSPDATAVAHYHAVFASLKAHGLTPMVTLYHWALPTWLQDLTALTETSGWLDPQMPDRFAAFAGWAATEYGGEVELWVTLNEPVVNLAAGYLNAQHPPLRSFATDDRGIDRALIAARNMIYGHAKAYDAIHAARPTARVSIAFHQRVFEASPSDDPKLLAANTAAAERLRYIGNFAFLNAVTRGDLDYDLDEKLDGSSDKKADPALKNRLDWIGLNYYSLTRVIGVNNPKLGPIIGLPMVARLDTENAKSEFGWDIYPDGFRTVLDELKPYALPIYITENGLADSTDGQRPRFLVEHLYVMQKAIQDGIDVRGYFHWSLLDNFEWGGGFCPRFGLYAVDFTNPTRPRTARPSAALYRKIIDARDVAPALFKQYDSYPAPTMTCTGGG